MAQDSIPTRAELVDYDGLDEEHVLKCFLGKSQEQAYAMVLGNPMYFTEDLTYMAAKGLTYYLPVYERYLRLDNSQHDADFAGGALTALHSRIKHCNDSLPVELLAAIKAFVAYVKDNQAKFEIDLTDKFYAEKLRMIEKA